MAQAAQGSGAAGFLITFEGPEGAGKSTQVRLLAEALERRGRRVLATREPGGTPLGEGIRRLVKDTRPAGGVCAASELLLFAASRAQLMESVIRPWLAAGGVVVCDRFADSTTAYQGHGRGLPLAFLQHLHEFSFGGRWPDLTFLLDLPAEQGLARRRAALGDPAAVDRIEAEPLAFHEAVRQGFRRLAAEQPERIRVLDARADIDTLHRQVMEQVTRALA